MASRINVYYKCCCGAEISFDVDEYKKSWLDERMEAFANLHKLCPEQMYRKRSEYVPSFVPGVYATNGNVRIDPANNQTSFSVVPDAFCRD